MRRKTLREQLDEHKALAASLQNQLWRAKDDASAAWEKAHAAEEQRASQLRELQALLKRARDLIIHEKVNAQLNGREMSYVRNANGVQIPGGWRLNGSTELVTQIDQVIRGI